MAEGIEAALAWSPPSGGGKDGQLPVALRPEGDRHGAPGSKYFVGWQRVMYLSGEPYPATDDTTAARTYANRVAGFKKADYAAKGSRPAHAGDTWEITKVERGGLWVRASARYVEAVRLSQHRQNFTRVPLNLLMQPPTDL